MKRLAPAEFFDGSTVTAAAVRRANARVEHIDDRRRRVLTDGDLSRIFKPGRELELVRAQDGERVRHVLTAAEAKNAKVLLGELKRRQGVHKAKVHRDATIAGWLGGARAGFSLSTVRRTRRIVAAAGVDVVLVRSDGVAGIRSSELTGARWNLDRWAVPLIMQLERGVVTGDDAHRVHERENLIPSGSAPQAPPAEGERGPPELVVVGEEQWLTVAERSAAPPHAPPRRHLETPPGRSWRHRRGKRSSGDVHPDVADDVRDEVTLLLELLRERWKVTDRWGIGSALTAAEHAAIAAGADPTRVAVARRRLAFELLGEQLALGEDGGACGPSAAREVDE